MKWENYNKMTNEDKEEYNYRFKELNEFKWKDIIEYKYLILSFFLVGTTCIVFASLLLTKQTAITESQKTTIKTLIKLSLLSLKFMVCWIIFEVMFSLLFLYTESKKRKQWLEEKGYKYTLIKQK